MSVRTNLVLAAVLELRQKQDARWGVNDYDGPTWLTIIAEEFGEVASLVESLRFWKGDGSEGITYEEHRQLLYRELIDLAGVSVAYAERLLDEDKGSTNNKPYLPITTMLLRLSALEAPITVNNEMGSFELALSKDSVFTLSQSNPLAGRGVGIVSGWIAATAVKKHRVLETVYVKSGRFRSTPILEPAGRAYREEYLAANERGYLDAQLQALVNLYEYLKNGLPAPAPSAR